MRAGTTPADRWVVAIGGNALADPRQPGSVATQEDRIAPLALALTGLLAAGRRLVIVHGNGPQVGARLLQNEAARQKVPPSSLPVCVAETQGQIGHLFALGLLQQAQQRNLAVPVVCLVTHVLVDAGAPEFDRPDKPVGPVYTEHDARRLAATRGWHIARTSAGGWRRAVASPRPVAVIEAPAVARLLDDGCCVIAGGGGGIPLADGPGGLGTVDGVVDKDYTAALLATAVGAKRLIVLTDVPGAALSFGNAEQRYLRELTVDQARHHLEQGEFAPGSMKPKVEACLEFLARGGESAVIAATTDAAAAFVDRAGTRLIG